MNDRYRIGSIVIEGIEPTEEYKECIKKEREGSLTEEEIKKIINRPYRIKDEKQQSAEEVREAMLRMTSMTLDEINEFINR